MSDRPEIRSAADLPTFTYSLPTKTASALLTDDAFWPLAERVEGDVRDTLSKYRIRDTGTLRAFYGTLEHLALLRGDAREAVRLAHLRRDHTEKPAEKLLATLDTEAAVAAANAGPDRETREAAYRASVLSTLEEVPSETVRDAVAALKGSREMITEALITGMVQTTLDPAAEKNGALESGSAMALIEMRRGLEVELPFASVMAETLAEHLAHHRTERPNIWAERDAALTDEAPLSPVVVAVWDTGVDPEVFSDRMVEASPVAHGGAHGLAYGLWGDDGSPDMLPPLSREEREDWEEGRRLLKGFYDLQAGVDSEEASAVRRRIAAMAPEEVQAFVARLTRYGYYAHGTHVAGIAVAGNPAARLFVVRETFPHEPVPTPLTPARAERWASRFAHTVETLRAHGVRVCTMSWGLSVRGLEQQYELNGIGAGTDDRRQMAAAAFEVVREGLRAALTSAPEILFVAGAGNSDENNDFSAFIPAALELPNVLAVGAVTGAGQPASFTSFGERVRVYASGVEVESYVPGGDRMAFSGTSMAGPAVANAAAKLLALDPSLETAEVVELLLRGAEPLPGDQPSGEGLPLLHTPHTLDLARAARLTA